MEFSIKIKTAEDKICELSICEDGIFSIMHTEIDGSNMQYNQLMMMDIKEAMYSINLLNKNYEYFKAEKFKDE